MGQKSVIALEETSSKEPMASTEFMMKSIMVSSISTVAYMAMYDTQKPTVPLTWTMEAEYSYPV